MDARVRLVNLLLVPSLIALSMLPTRTQAQEQSTDGAGKGSQNPIANMMSFPFQTTPTSTSGIRSELERIEHSARSPVLQRPAYHADHYPLVWQPDMQSNDGTSFGVGDILFTAFYAPPSEGVTWGIGRS